MKDRDIINAILRLPLKKQLALIEQMEKTLEEPETPVADKKRTMKHGKNKSAKELFKL
jgi:hypothetical protein